MRFSRRLIAKFSLGVVASLCTQRATAATLKVGSCQLNDDEHALAQFATIQAAVNASPAGSRILVCPGTYAEQVEITKPLTLIGVASGNRGVAVVVPPPSGLIVPPGGFTTTAPQVFAHDPPEPVIVANLTVDGRCKSICRESRLRAGAFLCTAIQLFAQFYAERCPNRTAQYGEVD